LGGIGGTHVAHVLTTCQPSTVWCSRERLPAAAAQQAKVRQSCSARDYYFIIIIIRWHARERRESVQGFVGNPEGKRQLGRPKC
jgi:hypothetical protein